MELIEPECYVKMIVLEEAHNLLKILKVLAVNVDVLAYNLTPFT